VTENWRDVSNGVLYNVQFARQLDEQMVETGARSLLTDPLFDLTPEQEYAALARALESDETLTDFVPVPHSEQDYRDFLRRLLDRLDAMRPWPELPFRSLPISEWDRFGSARPVGRVNLGFARVQERLHRAFRRVEGSHRLALLLRLRSGSEVALVAPWWQDSNDVAVLSNTPDRSPEQVVGEFIDATTFTSREITPLE
jgi:hypothetical protein